MRFTFLFILLIIELQPSIAQTFGLRVGGNVAWQVWQQQNVRVTPKPILAPHIGISVTSMQLKKLASQIEGSFSIIGHGGYSDASTSVWPDHLKFISIGLLAKFHPERNFNILAGPQVSFFVGNQDYLGKDDFAAVMGAEYYFSDVVGIGARYNLGITNLIENNRDLLKQRSRVIQLSLLFRLPSHQLNEHGF